MLSSLRVSDAHAAICITGAGSSFWGTTSPSEYVTVPGGSARFECASNVHRADALITKFQLNDTVLDETQTEINGSGVRVIIHSTVDQATLDLSNVSQDINNTRISCRFEFRAGDAEYTDTASLLVQGLHVFTCMYIRSCLNTFCEIGSLSAVDSLNLTASNATPSLTWEPPFTLDITNVDPDITGYCVDVINSTSSETVHSECRITDTEFCYPIPPDASCHIYFFAITAVNEVGMGEIANLTSSMIKTGILF